MEVDNAPELSRGTRSPRSPPPSPEADPEARYLGAAVSPRDGAGSPPTSCGLLRWAAARSPPPPPPPSRRLPAQQVGEATLTCGPPARCGSALLLPRGSATASPSARPYDSIAAAGKRAATGPGCAARRQVAASPAARPRGRGGGPAGPGAGAAAAHLCPVAAGRGGAGERRRPREEGPAAGCGGGSSGLPAGGCGAREGRCPPEGHPAVKRQGGGGGGRGGEGREP